MDASRRWTVHVLLLTSSVLIAACDAHGGASAADAGTSVHKKTESADAGSSARAITPKATDLGPKCSDKPSKLVDFPALAAQTPGALVSAVPLAIDATNIYFEFNHLLMSVPIRGGTVTTLSKLDTDPNLVLVDVEPIVGTTRVIVHFPMKDSTNDQIVSVPIDGGSATTLTVATGSIWGMAADEHNVYFVDEDGVKSIPANGGDVRILTDKFAVPHVGGFYGNALAVAGPNLIVSEGHDKQALESVPIDGGAPTTLATGQPNASFPMSCGADICWWSGEAPVGAAVAPGQAMRLPAWIARLDPSGKLTTIHGAPFFPWSLTFDGADFFETVGCDICDGTLLRIPSAGGSVVQMGAGGFATVDETCAYWSTHQGIFSAIKSYGTNVVSDSDGGSEP
jgi:hypothetical protein